MRAQALQPLLDEACRLADEGLEARFSKVLQRAPATNDFLTAAGTGWRPGAVGHVRLGLGHDSPAGYAFLACEPVISDDTDAEQRFHVPPILPEHGVRSAINVLRRSSCRPRS